MKSWLGIGLVIVAGACAPATTVTSAPTPPRDTAVVRVPPVVITGDTAAAAPTATGAPRAWWLQSTDAAGGYGASVERAYRELLAGRQPKRTVVVAIIDSGSDIEHDDIDDNVWTNPREVAGNGKDDDGNGYADDVHGWNFIGGATGEVNQDTYEVTRLYVQCQQKAKGIAGTYAPGAAECQEIEADYRDKLEENQQMLAQIRVMNAALTEYVKLLRAELNGDSLTAANVSKLRPFRNDVRQAQMMYLQLAQQGYSPQDVIDEQKRIEDLVQYSLNPEFDPRPTVGDNYLDLKQRVYGNARVIGPDATHGTGVAGVIGGERGNGLGEDGIAPAVRLLIVRTVPNGDERDKDVANAIRYAADNGANVINMSFGKSYSPFKQAVDDAVKYATQKGVLLVHAAGNDGANLAEEANFPSAKYLDGGESESWIEVGASSWKGARQLAAEFSNFGAQQVDLFAPGVDIHMPDVKQQLQTASGTSFAAPVVSGVAALVMAYYPELSAREVKQVLIDSATRLPEQMVVKPGTDGELVRFGSLSKTGGLVNAYEALKLAAQRVAAKK